ncbi:hypothetical protein [Janibacter sp. GXQ6167]|uniref:hypothetical protein n=1 Tax=Janibacter sp. GXQ6167 TaxID=3240791 RepID=UPI0035234209
MSDRHPSTPPPDEPDPTGVRHLLGSLGDPGPMPPDLVHRIQGSLDAAAKERASAGATPTSAAAAGPSEFEAARARRRGTRWVMPAAAAAAVLIVGGAFGIAALRGLNSSEQDSSVAFGGPSGATTEDMAPSSGPDQAAPPSLGASPFVLTISKTAYTKEAFTDQARQVADAPAEPVSPNAAEAPTLGPIATKLGAQDCLTSLGSDATAVRVDVGTFDGAPGMVLIARGPKGERTAWAVTQGCHLIYRDPAQL